MTDKLLKEYADRIMSVWEGNERTDMEVQLMLIDEDLKKIIKEIYERGIVDGAIKENEYWLAINKKEFSDAEINLDDNVTTTPRKILTRLESQLKGLNFLSEVNNKLEERIKEEVKKGK